MRRVTIVEFSDFECPACGQAFGDLRELVRVAVGRPARLPPLPARLPCNEAHPARAPPERLPGGHGRGGVRAQASTLLGVPRPLFENQKRARARRACSATRARSVSTSRPSARASTIPHETKDRVRDVATGAKLGIESTPTIFINGRQHRRSARATVLRLSPSSSRRTRDTGAGTRPAGADRPRMEQHGAQRRVLKYRLVILTLRLAFDRILVQRHPGSKPGHAPVPRHPRRARSWPTSASGKRYASQRDKIESFIDAEYDEDTLRADQPDDRRDRLSRMPAWTGTRWRAWIAVVVWAG